MQYRIRTQPEEWACTKFCRLDLHDSSVWGFIEWLCDRTHEQTEGQLAAISSDEIVWYDPVEMIWGWDAPRQRLAKLLWQFLNDASDEQFRHNFSFAWPFECPNSNELLAPIQQRLRWVLEGLASRGKEDDLIGQAAWGERWWLPSEQSEFVRKQLTATHSELIERSSDYEDAIRHGLASYIKRSVGGLAIPTHDARRVYIGERQSSRVLVWVRDSAGQKHPLKHGDYPYTQTDGIGFEWGYPGHGPGALTRSVLTDALDGDMELAEKIYRGESGFFETFVLNHPREKNFRLTRAEIHKWLKKTGQNAEYETRRESISASIAAHADAVLEKETLLQRIRETGGLISQRFDVVPENFEAALYLDLMRMLEAGGAALRCAHCGYPIAADQSGRANKQRARTRSGLPVYHPECSAEHARQRKRAYWQERAKLPQFKERERTRARAYRKLA